MNKFTEFPSGLLNDFDFYISKAGFIRDARYNNGQTTQLSLTGSAVKDGVLVSDEHEERYNLPPGWQSLDDGDTVQHEEAENFNRASQIARLFTRINEVAPDVIQKWLEQDFNPQESSIWLGTSWHVMELTEGEGKFKSTRNYPSAFLGYVDASTQAISSTGEEDFLAKLQLIAKAAPDHETFVNEAIALEGISQYSTLVKRIADPEDLYAELRA